MIFCLMFWLHWHNLIRLRIRWFIETYLEFYFFIFLQPSFQLLLRFLCFHKSRVSLNRRWNLMYLLPGFTFRSGDKHCWRKQKSFHCAVYSLCLFPALDNFFLFWNLLYWCNAKTSTYHHIKNKEMRRTLILPLDHWRCFFTLCSL